MKLKSLATDISFTHLTYLYIHMSPLSHYLFWQKLVYSFLLRHRPSGIAVPLCHYKHQSVVRSFCCILYLIPTQFMDRVHFQLYPSSLQKLHVTFPVPPLSQAYKKTTILIQNFHFFLILRQSCLLQLTFKLPLIIYMQIHPSPKAS